VSRSHWPRAEPPSRRSTSTWRRPRRRPGLIAAAGGRAEPFQCDTSKAIEIDRAVTVAIRTLGPLEIMVNNAGILDGYFNVDEMDETLWRRVIDIDLTGVFLGSKRALAEMLPRGRGRIVNMASVAGLNGTGGGAAYVAAKHGVVGLTRQMAVVYSSRGVTINAVCPGPILTNLRRHSQEILGPDVPDMSGRGIAVSEEQVRAWCRRGAAGPSRTSPPPSATSPPTTRATSPGTPCSSMVVGGQSKAARAADKGPSCFVGALGSGAQRTGSTPRARPSGAASHMDPSRRPG
jgi:NAD(P)-dependent dehydrogenase (short-subunit alcohol dehydrogenase family)